MKRRIEFLFDGNVVGALARSPTVPGRYRYEPERGAGHFRLMEVLDAGPGRCVCGSVEFVVSGVPTYGVLEVTEVEAAARRH